MTYIVTTDYKIDKIAAPNLPLAPEQWDRRYQDQFANVLRLYFNRLDDFIARLNASATFSGDGSGLQFPNGAFHQDGYTTLTSAIPNPSSTSAIQVASTAGFLSSGALLIGAELIKYTGKTATTFTGITRSSYGSSGSSHAIGAYVSEAQPVPSATSALTVTLTATDVANQVALDPLDNTKVVFEKAGYYNVQFSIQLLTCDSQIDDVTLWFRQNGTDVANSAGIVSVPAIHGGVPGAAIISWNLVLPLNANDYIQLLMASKSGNTVAATYPPGTAPTHPASPSIILTATFVSALY